MRSEHPKIPGFRCLCAAFWLLVLCFPISAAIDGTVLGFLFDREANGIRPVLGIPGASIQAKPLALGFSISEADISDSSDFALAVPADRGELVAVSNLRGRPSLRLLSVGRRIDLVRLSPRATAAVIYHAQAKSIQIISGLPAHPWIGDELPLEALPAPVMAAAISDDARLVLAAVAGKETGEVFAIGARGAMRLVFTRKHISTIAFVPGSHDAFAADDSLNQVWRVDGIDGAPSEIPIASESDGIARPVAIAVAPDLRHVFIVNSRSHSVVSIDLKTHSAVHTECPCVPTGLQPFAARGMLILNGSSPGPAWVFDGRGSNPRIFFVPPDRNHSPSTQDQQ